MPAEPRKPAIHRHIRHLKQAAVIVAGSVLLLAGVALLVLPGPGLLLVLAGLITLSTAFPRLERHIEPVRRRALQAAEDSVATALRITGSVLAGLALIAAGIVWGTVPGLPLEGWPTGSGLILSGLILLALLSYSYRRSHSRPATDPAPTDPVAPTPDRS